MTDTPAAPESAANALTVTIDLDQLARGAVTRYDEDGEPYPSGPDSLMGLVVSEAARQMLDRMDYDERRRIERTLTKAVTERVDQVADDIVNKTLATAVVVGQPNRPDNKNHLVLAEPGDEDAKPLAAVLDDRMREWLDESIPDPDSRDSYRAPRITRLALYARQASSRKVRDELRAAFDEGKVQVKAALREQGAQLLQEAIERQAAGR